MNGLDGWDINKLGWLKAGKKGGVVTSSLEQLAQAFVATVENCASGRYGGTFTKGAEVDRQLDIGQEKKTD